MNARSHIKGAELAMRKFAPLHRSTLVEYEEDRKRAAEAESNAPDLYAPAPRIPRDRPPAAGAVYWFVVAWALVAFCTFVGWHVLATWGQQ